MFKVANINYRKIDTKKLKYLYKIETNYIRLN